MSRPHPVRIALWRSLALLGTAGLILAGATTATAKSHKPPKPPKPPAVKGLEGLKILLTNDDSMQAARPNNSDGLGL